MMFSRLRSIWEELGIFVPCERPDDGDVTEMMVRFSWIYLLSLQNGIPA